MIKNDLPDFLGIITMMSIARVPNTRSYCSENTHNKVKRNCMCVNVFENIRRFVHFNDNTLDSLWDNHDRDWFLKVRPLVAAFYKKFGSVSIEEHLSSD